MDLELSKSAEISRLTQISEEARSVLGAQAGAFKSQVDSLKHQLDVPARFKNSLRIHPLAWTGGALVTGLVLNRLVRGRRKQPKQETHASRGVKGILLSVALAAAKPMIQRWLLGQVREKLSDQLGKFLPPQPVKHPRDFRDRSDENLRER